MKNSQKEWFASWFDTKYYHILYKNRDYSEAQLFLDKLIAHLSPKESSRFLDLACGKGRHSVYINQLGFNVLGLDLSKQSINFAKQYESDSLKFDVHDMREVYPESQFDYIVNLFTSFGYFESDADSLRMLNSVYKMLRLSGTFILDFFNYKKIITDLVASESKVIDGVKFLIKRDYDGKFIKKVINFRDNAQDFEYIERVRAYKVNEFISFFENNDFKLEKVWGDYHLNEFDEKTSPRAIFLLKKS